MHDKVEFQNPEKLPLGKLIITIKQAGISLKVPALNERWVEKRCYTKYKALPIKEGKLVDEVSVSEWQSEAKYFNDDLDFLLTLPHYKFWSTLVYDKLCMEAITSFFQEATPCYINLRSIIQNKNIVSIYHKILNNAFRIVCRMITNKESEEEWIEKEHLQELLYSKFLISIPLIFDLIVAYGRNNRLMLCKVIQTIFKIEPKYCNDLKISLQYFQNALRIIQQKAETEELADENNPGVQTLDDLAMYTLDCALTISIVLEILPQARNICSEIKMEQRISKFYDNAIPLLYRNIYTINFTSPSLHLLNQARMEFLKAFKLTVYINIESILKDPENSLPSAESYVAVLTECLADRTFVVDFQNYFPVESDIEIIKQATPDLDHFKVDFILKAYTSEGEQYLLEMLHNDVNNLQIEDKKEKTPELLASIENHIEVNVGPERDIDSEISAVKDVFPDLGDGYIRRLLPRYDNSEQAIAAILEGNLPPDLAKADKNEVYIPPDPQDKFYRETGIERRNNIFDGDQYDILTQDNPNCIIKTKKGFPGQPRNVKEMLDDKSHIQALKERYQQYSLVTEDNEYDDEYDDSYDALADSESKSTRHKISNDRFGDEPDDDDDDDNDESSEENENNNKNQDKRDTSKDFCENPEAIRARYEAQRAAKYANRGGGGKRNNNQPRDVIGKPKGQGQDDKTLFNRNKKEQNKSSRANHNRKSGASWKRSKGMIPS